MNKLIIAGNLGKDARLNSISGRDGPISVANFSVAVKERRGGDDVTLWVDCALWGKRADALAQYLIKGCKVAVSGQAGVDSYDDSQGRSVPKLTLRVDEITLMGGGEQRQATPAQQQRPAGNYQAPAAPASADDFESEIPF